MVLAIALVGCPKAPVEAPGSMSAGPVGGPWESPLYVDHPLVGRIWDVHARRFATEAELLADLGQASYVLIGEKHDSPDHHRLQARIVTALKPSACVFEMLDHADPIADATDAASLAAAADWEKSGWPEFSLYAPVFDACYGAGASVRAGHPTRDEVKIAMMQGMAALPPEFVADLPLSVTLNEAQRAQLGDEIVESHCGHATPELVEMMIVGQTLKDAYMARSLVASGERAVLIAGTGHTRPDHGVPIYLEPASRSVRLIEVSADDADPVTYGDDGSDWLWFTPRLDDTDPCEVFAEQLKKLGPVEPVAPAPQEPPK